MRINGGGKVALAPEAELVVGTSIEVDGGTLEVRGPVEAGGVRLARGELRIGLQGSIAVGGNVVMQGEAETVCEVSETGAGRIDAGTRVFLGGTLEVVPVRGETEFGDFTQTLVTAAEGLEGTFDHVPEQYGSDPGNYAAAHLGSGVFNKGVRYVGAPGENSSVEIDLFIALGGDTDGDGKVWLDDWLAFRPNFAPNGTEYEWTDGDFNGDGKVWLDDWLIFRPNFSPISYLSAEAAAVPEPGTLAMLGVGGLVSLGLLIRRKRRR